jgi:hypothetical protein
MKIRRPIEVSNIDILRDGGTIIFTIVSENTGWRFEFENPLMAGDRLRKLWVEKDQGGLLHNHHEMTSLEPHSKDETDIVELLKHWINENLSQAEIAELPKMDQMKSKEWNRELIPFYRIWSVIAEIKRSRKM